MEILWVERFLPPSSCRDKNFLPPSAMPCHKLRMHRSDHIILGIETSCDETAASVVCAAPSGPGKILSSIVHSQISDHAPYGGVVPEIAAREHLTLVSHVVERAMAEAALSYDQLSGVAATAGPGLIGGVMVGLTTGKAIALAQGLPFLPVNHLEAHALTARLEAQISFPYLLLLVSGGHCQIMIVRGLGAYELLGQTRDDAVGEAFDKAAKFLGLAYPGGPHVERLAAQGVAGRIPLPRPLMGTPGCDFSFSGLKTALQNQARRRAPVSQQDIADLCAALQESIIDCLCDRSANAMARLLENPSSTDVAAGRISSQIRAQTPASFVVAGGVAANQAIRSALSELADHHGLDFHVAPMALCTDNAAMIAWTGCEYARAGLWPNPTKALSVAPRARWPLGAA